MYIYTLLHCLPPPPHSLSLSLSLSLFLYPSSLFPPSLPPPPLHPSLSPLLSLPPLSLIQFTYLRSQRIMSLHLVLHDR